MRRYFIALLLRPAAYRHVPANETVFVSDAGRCCVEQYLGVRDAHWRSARTYHRLDGQQ